MYIKIAVLLLIQFLSIEGFYTTITTGYVGVLNSWGVIQKELYYPGPHFYNMITQEIWHVEIRPQTDTIDNIVCSTADGVKTIIKKIEVGNHLPEDAVYDVISRFGPDYDNHLVGDLVHHIMTVICSGLSAHDVSIDKFAIISDLLLKSLQEENVKRGSGLKFIFVRLSKPELPDSLNKNYLNLAEKKLQTKVLIEENDRINKEKNNEEMIQRRNNEIAKYKIISENEIIILNTERQKQEEAIKNHIKIDQSIAEKEAKLNEIEWQKEQYAIPGYVAVKIAESTANNMKIYYGDKLPNTLVGTGFNFGSSEYYPEHPPISELIKNQKMAA